MKRSTFLAVLVGTLLLSAGSAFASSHGAAPADLSFLGMIVWEVEHFLMHMGLTASALSTIPASPQFGWALLGDQTLCASMSPLVGVLFGSAWAALATFALTIVASIAFMVSIAMKMKYLLSAYLPSRTLAPIVA